MSNRSRTRWRSRPPRHPAPRDHRTLLVHLRRTLHESGLRRIPRGRAAFRTPPARGSAAGSPLHPRVAPSGSKSSNRDLGLDRGVRVIARELKVAVDEIEEAMDLRVEPHGREPARLAGELLARLLDVVQVE